MTSTQIRQSFFDFFRSKQHSIVPSASLLPDSPNLLFTNAGMNQFVPIFLGEKESPYSPSRAADTQKCVRAGGKHNDLEDVGMDTYHHTFFEMLGNWSFNDYFKHEAIEWAWELLTHVWKFPPQRLYATIYAPDKNAGDPADFDHEAHAIWAKCFSSAGLDPAVHIVNGSKKDNFWMMGETGPCGPCTEIHVDLSPAGDTNGSLVNKSSPLCMEIWNLVFIQFNANPDASLSPLPARHVDTGMGLERVTSIIQCTKNFTDFSAPVSNYETDIFRPLFNSLEQLSNKRYSSSLPSQNPTAQERIDIAFRVIADHIRTLSFAIADGIFPGNTGRNYVLRRILRRAVRYGRTLDLYEPFVHKLTDVLAQTMGDVFPEIRTHQQTVKETIHTEEETFNKTLDRGLELFTNTLARSPTTQLPGDFAFKLYDTYGFPLDLTQLLAREHGLTIDTAAFDLLMDEQRTRAKAAQKRETIQLSTLSPQKPTRFLGYDLLETNATLLEIVQTKNGSTALIFDQTPFYAEMGGQIGDSGSLRLDASSWRIRDTRKTGDTFLHILDNAPPAPPSIGSTVILTVSTSPRRAIERHHTATHLLHWALHKVIPHPVSQKGSLVSNEKLTFDFNSAPLSHQQLLEVEKIVNEKIMENAPVSWTELPYADVKNRPDIMQFFGDKYGNTVRIVQIGGTPRQLDGYSMELCGGTHVRTTGEIGSFHIISENAIAAGVRRIEALTGEAAFTNARTNATTLRLLAQKTGATPSSLPEKITQLLDRITAQEKSLRAYRQREQTTFASSLSSHAKTLQDGVRTIVADISNSPLKIESPAALRELANEVSSKADIVLLLTTLNDKSNFVCLCSPIAISKNYNAGKIISTLCSRLGGKGGGKPEAAMGATPHAPDTPAILANLF
ncbi:MAG: alanine--tRNA ligase [Puniceicoccales bacterium]|jgi:alanyl-tRNA synthetase|nr:alanine--tRNA ligase [Puniceicoccales bacterium]